MKKTKFLAVGMVLLLCAFPVKALATKYQVNQTPTKDEILEEYTNSQIKTSGSSIYDFQPVTSGDYYSGVLSQQTLNETLALTNFIRYITGLDPVSLNDSYNEYAQSASLINAINGGLSHTPTQSNGMSDELYFQAYKGASSSNLARGYSMSGSILGYMSDSDTSNISRVGHRRWVLNPSMGQAGFGIVNNVSAMYVFDRTNTNTHQTATIWPTTNMPLSFFKQSDAWSVSTGTALYGDVTVELTKIGEETIVFTSEDTNTSGKYFNVNNSGYGQTGCVIFRPINMTYSADDVFNVVVKENSSVILDYDVTFFSLAYVQKTETENADGSITTIETNDTTTTEYITYPNGLKILKNNNQYIISNVIESTQIILPTTDTLTQSHVAKNASTGEIFSFGEITSDGLKLTVDQNITLDIVDNSMTFSDIAIGSWYKQAIDFVTSRELFTGTTDTSFSPNQTMSKAMIWTVLYRYTGGQGATTGANWYLMPQIWVKDNNLSSIDNPLEAMTREDLAIMLYVLEGSPQILDDYTSSFADSYNISENAQNAMNWAVSVGLYQGNDSNTLNPTNTATRAEVATIFMRYMA